MTSTWYGKREKIILKLSYMTKILSTQPSCTRIFKFFTAVFPSYMFKSISTIAKYKLISTQNPQTSTNIF